MRTSSKVMKVSDDRVVAINFVLRDDAGAHIEESGDRPLVYLHGHGQVVAGLERGLHGLEVGGTTSLSVSPAEGYGEYDPSLVFAIPVERIGNETPPVGTLLEMDNPEGVNYRARVIRTSPAEVTVDANHPLAGVHLVWEVEVVSIREAELDKLGHRSS